MGGGGAGRAWEALRKEARKLEGEIDSRLAGFAKSGAGFEASPASSAGALGGFSEDRGASEIDALLRQLQGVNHGMAAETAGARGGDARAHTLARHRDILQEYTQEFRRLQALAGEARERAELFGSSAGTTPLLGIQVQGGQAQALLRERGHLQSTSAALDGVVENAQNVAHALGQQRRVFEGMDGRLAALGQKFPALNGLLGAIRRKKSRDTLVLSSIVALGTVLLLLYWLRR